jgi:hypothetical protein
MGQAPHIVVTALKNAGRAVTAAGQPSPTPEYHPAAGAVAGGLSSHMKDSPMNKAEAVKEILDEMRDNIVDEILQATRQIERLNVPDAENARLLADQLLDVLMDIFPNHFPELHGRARAMYAANRGKVPTRVTIQNE